MRMRVPAPLSTLGDPDGLMGRTWAWEGVTISGVMPASTGRQLTGTTIDLRRFNVRVRRE